MTQSKSADLSPLYSVPHNPQYPPSAPSPPSLPHIHFPILLTFIPHCPKHLPPPQPQLQVHLLLLSWCCLLAVGVDHDF
ncbi:unnamed protein product [Rodentolepis nana]|uniref:Ovule protein n=1 Tax=Rodentolepis nana TaxID=102285 RepID=A0A0R3TIV0_RODNA|nr:unnamed protein product [Rodentolepis nana]